MLLRAFFALLFGVFTLLMPGPTLAALAILFAVYLIADGVVGGVATVQAARHQERWGWQAAAAGGAADPELIRCPPVRLRAQR